MYYSQQIKASSVLKANHSIKHEDLKVKRRVRGPKGTVFVFIKTIIMTSNNIAVANVAI